MVTPDTPDPDTPDEGRLREKFLLTLEMFDSGVSLMRERLRREHPSLSEAALDAALRGWLADRPPDAPVDD